MRQLTAIAAYTCITLFGNIGWASIPLTSIARGKISQFLNGSRFPAPQLSSKGHQPSKKGSLTRLGNTAFRHGASVLGLAYSPDGGYIASASYDNTIRISDAKTGEKIADLYSPLFPISKTTYLVFVDLEN